MSEARAEQTNSGKKMSNDAIDYQDVIIVGAGLSGIGAAVHLIQNCPGKTYTLLESRKAVGGTWDLFRYPGIRSDSDMHTLGYNFKPWREAKSIADGPSIRNYVNETADEYDIRDKIRFEHSVKSAAWSSEDGCWYVDVETADGSVKTIAGNMLFMCGGYYNYEEAFTPDFKGMDDYKGEVIHPQFWPENLEYKNKKVIIIGSGATAMTLVPSMAEHGADVTMVQRSPTYVVSAPDKDKIANGLRKILPEKWAYAITRFKNIKLQRFMYERTRTAPEKVKAMLLKMVRKELGPDYDVDKHFTPSYNPWDQRMCLVPNSDLFQSIKSGSAKVVTEHIDCFTEKGLKLANGEELEADVIVTATGLKLTVMSGVEFLVDGKKVHFPDTFSYKGMMYSDVPNMVHTFGYVNASWTLRADLTAEYACKLVNRMDELGMRQCTAVLPVEDSNMPSKPWIDDFTAGYMSRVMHLFPKQGEKAPWVNTQNYILDKKMVRNAALEDGVLTFDNPKGANAGSQAAAS